MRARLPAQPGSCGPRGSTAADGPNFVKTMARLAGRARARSTVVDDQRGQPTWTMDVADGRSCASSTGAPRSASGTPPSRGRRTWFGWPGRSSRQLGLDPERVLARLRPTRSRCRRRGRPTACCRTTCGPWRGSSRCRTGVTACTALRPRCWGPERPHPGGPQTRRVLKSIVGRAQAAVLPRTHHGTSQAGVKLPPTVYRMGGAHFRQDDTFVASAVAEVGRLDAGLEVDGLEHRQETDGQSLYILRKPWASPSVGSGDARRHLRQPVRHRPARRPRGRANVPSRRCPTAGPRSAAHDGAEPPRPVVAARRRPARRPAADGPRL